MSNNPAEANRPMRAFERVLKAGLGAGNIGIMVSPHGTGKNAILTSIAIDQAMSGQNVLHIAIGKSVSDIRAYHDEILSKIEDSVAATDRAEILTRVERHSQIYTFRGGQFDVAKLASILSFLATHAEFRPGTIMFQGWPDITTTTAAELQAVRDLARQYNAAVWIPVHAETGADGKTLPASVGALMEHFEVAVTLGGQGKTLPLHFVRVHGATPSVAPKLEFDPASMLIRWN
jgi:hypothetical protein